MSTVFWPAQPACWFAKAAQRLSLAADPERQADPDWRADRERVSASVSCPAAAVDRHCRGWAAAADSGAQADESPAAAVAEAAGADAAADWDAPLAASASVVADAADGAAAAGASSSRGAHTKGVPRSSVPSNRRD
jgi:hypothetical protein